MCIRDRYQRRVRDTHRANMKFVVAYDGSEHSKEALLYALPYLAGNEVVVWVGFKPAGGCFCSLESAERSIAEGMSKAETLAAEAIAMIGEAATSVGTHLEVVPGKLTIGQALVKCAEFQLDSDYIVLGTRGMGEIKSKVYGSVAQSVLFENSHIPALIVHPGAAATRDEFGHSVLFALDGSERSLQAVDQGRAFVGEGCEVFLFHADPKPVKYTIVSSGHMGPGMVVNNEFYDQECEKRTEQNRTIGRLARERLDATLADHVPVDKLHLVLCDTEVPSAGVQQCRTEKHVDLVVVGSRGETGMSRIWNGSLAHDLLHEPEGFAVLVTHQRG
eukprot:TRINITY_DN8015_c0_g1_i13.p2 TRINITY_DN8015_c0_g1~~TRINITY_DN8015_c0_g1_i13.p2  ORF type:complete len:332 (+),score=76.68 TRINITY_DN8015_c0_g1_i13:129-1124(+)